MVFVYFWLKSFVVLENSFSDGFVVISGLNSFFKFSGAPKYADSFFLDTYPFLSISTAVINTDWLLSILIDFANWSLFILFSLFTYFLNTESVCSNLKAYKNSWIKSKQIWAKLW